MFEVRHDHHGHDFKRYFSPGRSSMTALGDKRAEELRRHVWTVTMIDEDPFSGQMDKHSTALTRPSGPNKLRSKRRASACGALPQNGDNEKHLLKVESLPELTNLKGPIMSVQPTPPTSFGPPKELHPVREDPRNSIKAANTTTTASRASYPTYSIYPGLATPPHVDPSRVSEAMPASQNRPRNLSNTSTATLSSMHSSSRESTRSASSSGSRTSYESMQSASQWRPDYMYQRPMPLKKRKPPVKAKPNQIFASLPSEVLGLIVDNLKDLHFQPKSFSCATCWMRDLCNLSLASRKWYKVARIALYEDIQLVGPDSAAHKKKYKLNQGVRVMMLRRTLRANPRIAAIVRSVKVPAPETPAKASNSKGTGLDDYENLIASLVMACPNLERLDGLNTVYDHSFKRIFHALSTRTQLKEMNWVVQVSTQQRHQQSRSSTQSQGFIMPGDITPSQAQEFLRHHDHWSQLEKFTIHCLPGATLTGTLLRDTLNHLPSLKHLHLCNIPVNAFNDSNLLSLPPLHTLTLSHISGITPAGLSSFATRSSSLPLRKLHLRHTPLTSLPALARILSNLRSLTTLSIVQAYAPVMPEDDVFTLWMMPYLASSTLKKLHWDITSQKPRLSPADSILARSIAAGGFPELKLLRIPNDPEGIFQDLCRPLPRIALPADRFRAPETGESKSPDPPSPTRNPFKSSPPSSRTSSAGSNGPPPCTNLHASRLAAQSRLESARNRPRFTVNVFEEDGTLVNTFKMAGWIGTPTSKIRYHLLPDPGSNDRKGGLLDVRDLDGDGGESLAGDKEGCEGWWNRDVDVSDRKEREKWWHTERGRWRKLEL